MPQLRSFTLKNKRLLPSQTWKDSGKGPELGPQRGAATKRPTAARHEGTYHRAVWKLLAWGPL